MAGSQFKNWWIVLYISTGLDQRCRNVLSFQCPKIDCLLLAVYERRSNGYVINDERWNKLYFGQRFQQGVYIYVCLCGLLLLHCSMLVHTYVYVHWFFSPAVQVLLQVHLYINTKAVCMHISKAFCFYNGNCLILWAGGWAMS